MQQQQQQSDSSAATALLSAAASTSYPKILQWSVCKIADSRRRKSGIDLRRNLLIANVIFKARSGILQQRAKLLLEERAASPTSVATTGTDPQADSAASCENQSPQHLQVSASSQLGKRTNSSSSSSSFNCYDLQQSSVASTSDCASGEITACSSKLPKLQTVANCGASDAEQQQQQQILGVLQASALEIGLSSSQTMQCLTCSS